MAAATPPVTGKGRMQWKFVVVSVIIVLVFVGIVGFFLASNLSKGDGTGPTGTSSTQSIVIATAILPNGTEANGLTYLTYKNGQQEKVSISVPRTSHPVSIEPVLDGVPQGVNPWSVNATGYNYQLTLGELGFGLGIGSHTISALVTFADGTHQSSNTLVINVN